MFPRQLALPADKSFFLLGPRGTGKSTALRHAFPEALFIDLLDVSVYTELLMHPERLEARALPHAPSRIVIDEVQRLPGLPNEVHRLEWNDEEDGRVPRLVIDGKGHSWEDLGRMLMSFEGFQLKLEVYDRSEER